MPLSPGDKLGPYEIQSKIGAGGMGDVYKARDTRLSRTVAIKVLPAESATDPERRKRFELEARAVAALNHPNVVAIYDVGAEAGVDYIVQELIDGESLRARLATGPIPLRAALPIAAQIAEGLAAAHQANIVHRDLKPENIMLTGARAKVLDFGLARLNPVTGPADATQSLFQNTQQGVVMGTLGYMSPEQVRGLPADARSDIFSFGLVLYEMLSGHRAFQRDTAADGLSAILKEEPPELPETVPAHIRLLIQHCLEKEPANRFQSAKDLAFAFNAGPAEPPKPKSNPKKLWPYALAAAVAIAAFLTGAAFIAPPIDIASQHHRLVVSRVRNYAVPSWAPDGKSFAFNIQGQVVLQNLDTYSGSTIFESSAVANLPNFSPDGSRVYISSIAENRSVWSVGTAGGTPQLLFKDLGGLLNLDGVAISRDGKSLVVAREVSGKVSLAISSPPGAPLRPYPGAPQFASAGLTRLRLRFSHDGRQLLLLAVGPRATMPGEVWLLPWPENNGAPKRIHPELVLGSSNSNADWLTDNRHLLFAFQPRNERRGGQFLIVDTLSDASYRLGGDSVTVASPAVAPDGRILYTEIFEDLDIAQLSLSSPEVTTLRASDWVERGASWSRSGAELAFVSDRTGSPSLWLSSANGSWLREIATHADLGLAPGVAFQSTEFSPDGQRLAYMAGPRLWVSPVAGGRATPISSEDSQAVTPTWSPDGLRIAYRAKSQIMVVQLGSAAIPVPIAQTGPIPIAWSPDGKWITASFEGGIGVVSPDGTQRKLLTRKPLDRFGGSLGWSRDGAVLYYTDRIDGANRLLSVEVATGRERVIHDYPPSDDYFGELSANTGRLYPSADGKSLIAPRYRLGSRIWMLEGVTPPRPLWRRLFR
jgi:serine/threonine protein kinase